MAETNPTCASAGQNKFYMRKIILSAAGAVLLAASAFTFVSVNKSNDPMDDLFKANVEALARNEVGGYPCPGACLTWSGSTGGGLDCFCHRYTGRCKKWCD